MELNQVREELEECVRSLDLDKAQALKLKLGNLEEEYQKMQSELNTPAATPVANTRNMSASSSSQESQAEPEPQEKDDPQTLARCLAIVCQMLRSVEISDINSALYSLHDNLLLPCLKNQVFLVIFCLSFTFSYW